MRDLYEKTTVVTAHRGFSGRFPENTLTAFREAMAIGAHIIEFDVRETHDHKLVVLHDTNLDRTTDGNGPVTALLWEEVRQLNATYWLGPGGTGRRRNQPVGDEGVPLLTDVLDLLGGKVGLNIQVYIDDEKTMLGLARLFMERNLTDSAFLMLRSFEVAGLIRERYPRIPICVGEDRGNLERHIDFGVDYMQPRKDMLTDEFIRKINRSKIPYNVFYANTEEDMRDMIARGVRGIMTDYPDILLRTLGEK